MKFLVQVLSFLCLLLQAPISAYAEVLEGHIFRISYESTGNIISLQTEAGADVKSSASACSKKDTFYLPSDTPNYKVISAMIYSYHANAIPLRVTLDGCRLEMPLVSKVQNIL